HPYPVLTLDPNQLKLIIRADEGAMVRDAATGELVAVVIRNFCKDAPVLDYVNSTITVACDSKRDSRVCKQDPGTLVLAGYSAGSRSAPIFDWCHNIELTKPSAEFIQSHEMAVSSSFAIFYNLACAQLPAELLDDLHSYLETNGFPRMDANGAIGTSEDGRGEYYVQRGEDTIVFCHEKLAPPSGVMGVNYARHMHRETHPHKYAYSWTTGRTAEVGGHFYVSEYGIKIEQSANTFIAWQPRLMHGTSLIGNGPNFSPPYAQQGLSIVSSARLASIWQKYKGSGLPQQEAAKKAVAEYAADMENDLL
ncbi:uncharacterized protein C8Q71DRAFT_710792, partial [Rhodofomes roseus]